MKRAKIPVAEYEKLTQQFNPVNFNAQDAGMKYIPITAKHHDGFAMFGSEAQGDNFESDVGQPIMAAGRIACPTLPI